MFQEFPVLRHRRLQGVLRRVSMAAAVGAVSSVLAVVSWADDRGQADRNLAADHSANRSDPSDSDGVLSSNERIEALIRQLGSPRFSDRRLAASMLNDIGPEAFDQLHAATDAADPEIAASARYLLRQINVRWTRGDDSATVRRRLRDFSNQDDAERAKTIYELAELPERDGVAGLCRIVRFDRSELVSRKAAVAILRQDDGADVGRSIGAEVIDRELGSSTRIASQWLRHYLVQLRDPAASIPTWRQLIDDETSLLEENADETSSSVVSDLLWNLADIYRRLDESTHVVDVVDHIMTINDHDSSQIVLRSLQWFLKREAWTALDQFASKYDIRIREMKTSMYLLAAARARQGRSDVADQLAEDAVQLAARHQLESVRVAQIVAAYGHFDWAVREYRNTLGDEPPRLPDAVSASVLLSSLLQDYEKWQEAAEAVEPLVRLLEGNREFTKQYQRYQSALRSWGIRLPDAHAVKARYHFLQACDFEQQGAWHEQREQLLLAIGHDKEDADVLIAMYHSQDADDQWRETTLKRIQELKKEIEENIGGTADEADLSNFYNQWAWLVANTEGDYQKAVRYSRRSLELLPNTASYLDTLGRCYYSAGDGKNALKYQRQAVKLIPHMQVMQRQLKLFEEQERGKAEGGRRKAEEK